MGVRYTVELLRRSKYYNWGAMRSFMMICISPARLETITESDEDHLLALF